MFWIAVVVMTVVTLGFIAFPMVKGKVRLEQLYLVLLLTLVPLAALLGYELGRSAHTMDVQAVSPEVGAESGNPDPLKMVAQLEGKMKGGAGTPDQWLMLARSYGALKRYQDSVNAYAKATEVIVGDAQVYADYADALGMLHGRLDAEAESIVDKALVLDPVHPKALALKGTAAFNRQDYPSAIDAWEKMLTSPALGEEWAKVTRENIDEARSLLRKKNGK